MTHLVLFPQLCLYARARLDWYPCQLGTLSTVFFSAGQRELAAGLVLGREMEESQMVFLFLVDAAFIPVFCSNTVQRGQSLHVVMEGLRT